jgi:sugar transferase (PEP-CTERM/EpsH1 system associated)
VKILLVSPWFPYPAFGGALIRVFETLRYLASRHRVTLLAPTARAPHADDLRVLTGLGIVVVPVRVSESGVAMAARLMRGVVRRRPLIQGLHSDPALARQLTRLTSDESYDVVHFEHSFMAPYVDSIHPANSAKRVLSMHNIESLRFRREMRVARWGVRRLALTADHVLFGGWEARAIHRFDGIAAVSPIELTWARSHAPAAASVLAPNGVRLEQFAPAARNSASRRIVFTGLMNYPPNVDAVVWFCEAILPAVRRRFPHVTFSIVGDKPTARVRALARCPGVTVTGAVPDVRPHIADAALTVVPLRSGAGTRLKILEAMAMQRAVVSTSQGAEGLDVTPGLHLLMGDTPETFADQVCAVLADSGLRNALEQNGRELVESKYEWRRCLRSLDHLYETLTGGSCASASAMPAAMAR